MSMRHTYDIIIFGGGIAGLFLANRLTRAGYNLILIEKDSLGGGQTLASQGMIHGGQKYALQGRATGHTQSISVMPPRWDACFEGWGEIDLSGVKSLSDTQVMFHAGGIFSRLAVFAAALAVRGRVRRRGNVYEMQEKVLDVKSLIAALSKNLRGRIFKGEAAELLPDGQVAVAGISLRAQAIIFTAGTGNETALKLLNVKEQRTQRRPLRQIMVKPMGDALYGHGVVGRPKPRVTITGHPLNENEYVWYLGGELAERGAVVDEAEALRFAKKEMTEIFPHVDWSQKEWASWQGDRAEPFDASGRLPPGPCVQQLGKILVAWPTKLTFAPALADSIQNRLNESGIAPSPQTAAPDLPEVDIGLYPWENARWQRL